MAPLKILFDAASFLKGEGTMKYLTILTVGVNLLLASAPAVADQAADEKAIREASDKIMAAYSAHDTKAGEAFYDKTIESWDGSGKGPAAHAKMLAEGLKNQPKMKGENLDEIGIVFVTPDVAIHKLYREYTGLVDEDGKPMPKNEQICARVFVKRNGKWLLAAYFAAPRQQ
jgi:hypothetical protein